MFASPMFLLGASIATLYAAAFHLLVGRTWRQILLYWLVSLVGFLLGQALGAWLALPWPMLGQLHIIPASLLAWTALGVARLFKL